MKCKPGGRPTDRYRVLLADDHRIFLAGLTCLLEAEFEVAAAVEDGRALLEAAELLRPDVIVADVIMPLINGIEATRRLRLSVPEARVVLLTGYDDARFRREALAAGASSYVLKGNAPEELLRAIREAAPDGDRRPSLTSRQGEILRLVAEGHTLKEMAALLHLSVKTVEFHKYRLMRQLGVRSTAELAVVALRHGFAGKVKAVAAGW